MAYYSERHGVTRKVTKTYEIDIDTYELLLNCCERRLDNLAWKCTEKCPDSNDCCGLDSHLFKLWVKREIPDLFTNREGEIAAPSLRHNVFSDEPKKDDYDQYALLDFIELVGQNIKDFNKIRYHDFFHHHHLAFIDSHSAADEFRSDVNHIFEVTGLLYRLSESMEVERLVDNDPLTSKVEATINAIPESGARELASEAIRLHRKPGNATARDAAEKIWDAFERLKTYYEGQDKKNSAARIVRDASNGSSEFEELLDSEFHQLTKIGNSYRIRHHETDKIEITDSRHYDYLFNRCLSLISLVAQYLK